MALLAINIEILNMDDVDYTYKGIANRDKWWPALLKLLLVAVICGMWIWFRVRSSMPFEWSDIVSVPVIIFILIVGIRELFQMLRLGNKTDGEATQRDDSEEML